MEPAERALLAETVRGAIEGVGPVGPDGRRTVDGVLTDLGWLEMLETEPRDAIDIVFDVLGATNAVATVLDDVVISALGMQPRRDLAVLLPPFGSWAVPGRVEGDRIVARGLASARAATAAELLVVCEAGPGLHVLNLPIACAEVHAVHGIDPEAALHSVRIDRDVAAGTTVDAVAWGSAVVLGRRAVARQIAGASGAMLALARGHALERVQFGRPVARFQAVRHRLAEALVALEALDATLTAAGDEPGPDTAALAKAVAGRTARTVGAHCQQVLAGIGFTTDHPFHRFLKRTMVLEGLLGSADDIVVDLGHRLITSRTVPTLVEL